MLANRLHHLHRSARQALVTQPAPPKITGTPPRTSPKTKKATGGDFFVGGPRILSSAAWSFGGLAFAYRGYAMIRGLTRS